jgi:hypothetical protein
MEHRNSLAAGTRLTMVTATAEREAAISMVDDVLTSHRITVAADKAYDDARFVRQLRGLNAAPHTARKDKRSTIERRTTSHPGYGVRQRIRKRVEEIFGWLKTVALLRKNRHRGKGEVPWIFICAMAAYTLVRMRNFAMETPA